MRNWLFLLPIAVACAFGQEPTAGGSAAALPSGWSNLTHEIVDQSALAHTTAAAVAGENHEFGSDNAVMLQKIDATALNAARIQADLYELEKLEQGQAISEDARLDRIKEEADRLSVLTDDERSALVMNPGHPDWRHLRGYAKAAARQAAKLEKDAATLSAKGELHAR